MANFFDYKYVLKGLQALFMAAVYFSSIPFVIVCALIMYFSSVGLGLFLLIIYGAFHQAILKGNLVSQKMITIFVNIFAFIFTVNFILGTVLLFLGRQEFYYPKTELVFYSIKGESLVIYLISSGILIFAYIVGSQVNLRNQN